MLGTSSSSCSASGCKSLKTGSSCSRACFADALPKKGRLGASAAAAAARLLSWPSSCRRASPAEALPKKLSFDGAASSLALPKNESFDGAGSSAPKARRGSSGHHGLLVTVRGMLRASFRGMRPPAGCERLPQLYGVLALVDGVKRRFCLPAAFAGFRGGDARQPFGFSARMCLLRGVQHQSASGLHAKSKRWGRLRKSWRGGSTRGSSRGAALQRWGNPCS